MPDPRLVLVDGTAMLLRPYFAGSPDPVRDALRRLQRVIAEASHAALLMDISLDTFRRDLYPQYKIHRAPADAPLIARFEAFAREAEGQGLPVFADARYEADDLAATLARRARREGLPVVIEAADKDLFQLVRDEAPALRVTDSARGWAVDEAEVWRRLGVRPDQVVDFLALVGDASDGVPGVRGVGPKTAAALLGAFGDLDALYARLDELPGLPLRGARGLATKLAEDEDRARLARRLVRLVDDAPLPADALARCRRG